MNLALGAKDVVYIVVNIATVVAILVTFRNRIKNLEEANHLTKSVLFQDDSTLNLVNVESCRVHRDSVYNQIRREAAVTNQAFEKIDRANEKMDKISNNILKIAFHMGVELKE